MVNAPIISIFVLDCPQGHEYFTQKIVAQFQVLFWMVSVQIQYKQHILLWLAWVSYSFLPLSKSYVHNIYDMH